MKKFILLIYGILIISSVFAQNNQITDKGYFYSYNGFTAIDGCLFTADMSTMIRYGFKEHRDGYQTYEIYIPKGACVIPSNILYYPTICNDSGNSESIEFIVYIPSTVKWIAPDAFMAPFISFSSYDDEVNPVQKLEQEKEISEVERYNLQGHRLQNPEIGINIVKYSNNTARKEKVK